MRGSPRRPSIDSKIAVSSPQMYAPAPRRISMSNAKPSPITSVAEEAAPPRLRERVLEGVQCLGVLAAQVDVALRAARRVRGDRHRLDERERVALEQGAILERPGLRLVGVADEVVRPRRLSRDRLPLHPCRERGAAAAEELRVLHLAEHALRAELDRAAQRGIASLRAVVVEAPGVDDTDPPQQPQRAVARLRKRRGRRRGGLTAREQRQHVRGARRRLRPLERLAAGDRDERGRGTVALTETRAAVPRGRAIWP